jgi:hypothetical protein
LDVFVAHFESIFSLAAVSEAGAMCVSVTFPRSRTRYLNTVGDAVAEPLVGGSEECLRVVADGHARIGELLKTSEGRGEVADLFNVCGGMYSELLSFPAASSAQTRAFAHPPPPCVL